MMRDYAEGSDRLRGLHLQTRPGQPVEVRGFGMIQVPNMTVRGHAVIALEVDGKRVTIGLHRPRKGRITVTIAKACSEAVT